MKKLWFGVVVTAVILFVGSNIAPVSGEAPEAPDPEQRIVTQQKRIDQALQAKEITPDDAKPLQGGLDKIRGELTRMKADGQLSKEEKDKLNSMLNQNSQLINKTREASKTGSVAPTKPAATPAPGPRKAVTPAAKVRPPISDRLARQQERIDQGVKSKELTREEVKVLQSNLNYIKNEDARVRAGGKLSEQERNRIHILLDQNSEMIENKKHNPVKALK